MSIANPSCAELLIASGQTDGLTVKVDDVAQVVLDDQGQGYVEVDGRRTYSMWACAVCGIPTGGSDRACRNHPSDAVFMQSIREEPSRAAAALTEEAKNDG